MSRAQKEHMAKLEESMKRWGAADNSTFDIPAAIQILGIAILIMVQMG